MTKLAVFDCDGTLADGQANICRAMALAFADAALPAPDPRAVRRIVGLSLPQAVALLAPAIGEAGHQTVAEGYKRHFRAMRIDGRLLEEPLFPGIAELLDRLIDAGWRLGVATGKSDRGLALLLAHHGLSRHFVTLQTADRHPSKPDPAMLLAAIAEAGATRETTVMIGDTAFDMGMARAGGTRAIGVEWGYHPPAELVAAGADALAQDAVALGRLLEVA
ncbi:haloacid dehalogenase [Sphingomonas sp. Leaf407]|uniref:HAD-IA family hydrolase n=1 Tax=unclassified Sphingomonas TaxID=196159 RepID=UPI0006F36CDC|nr:MULTISPECIES: HAD-IA family hydrolase [unclassified Sphingomonas]KQN35535.1 haloacid dehalogenase [Sphingomonas sp. Leaf42]KQT26402.1 haloacid dehalogenase [Sphingomonas sp. Leaf407]